MIIPHPRGHKVLVSRQWIEAVVFALWGIHLQPFQLEDLEKLARGGIYALMYPTDHGKSMLIEMAAVIRLIVNPNRRVIVIKINDDAAKETAKEICRKLRDASYLVDHGAGMVVDLSATASESLYSWVEPIGIRWAEGDEPVGVSDGFDIIGINRAGRNTNHSVRCYGLGSRDLQGKRGDTFMDDIERQEEARSLAYRTMLEVRVSAVLRTLEDDPETVWCAAGTPTHEESVYYTLCQKLADAGVAYEEIWRPIRNDDGSLLWPDRARKVEIHRRLMSKTEWNAAYELRPNSARKLTRADVENLVKDTEMPWIADERALHDYLLAWSVNQRPPTRDPGRWLLEVAQRLESLEFYIGWDPATTGDWAISQWAVWGRRQYLLRARLAVGDTWDQVLAIKSCYENFPSSTIVVEKNGQQKAFKDVAEEDELLRYAPIVTHGTYSNKDSDVIGLPAWLNEVREGWLRVPWQDANRSEDEFDDFLNEVQRYGPTSHPHLLVSIWFCWAYHRRHEVTDRVTAKLQERKAEQAVEKVRILMPRSRAPRIASPVSESLRRRTREAWGRRHR